MTHRRQHGHKPNWVDTPFYGRMCLACHARGGKYYPPEKATKT